MWRELYVVLTAILGLLIAWLVRYNDELSDQSLGSPGHQCGRHWHIGGSQGIVFGAKP